MIEPLLRSRIVTWTKARRLPGVRCSTLVIRYRRLSSLMPMFGRRSVDFTVGLVRGQVRKGRAG